MVGQRTAPLCPSADAGDRGLGSVPFEPAVDGKDDCAAVTTDHSAFDFEQIAATPLVVDHAKRAKLESSLSR